MSTRGLSTTSKILVVAIDHALYSWPCVGLEARADVLEQSVEGGADAIIASYGTMRRYGVEFGETTAIMKLDLTTSSLGDQYPVSPYRLAWTVDNAASLGAGAVLTFVQLGADDELEALTAAARTAVRARELDLAYVCEIMPIESERFPDPTSPIAIAAAARVADELGADLIKTSIPDPVVGISQAVEICAVPVILAGGAHYADPEEFYADVAAALAAGAHGMAVGRNVWGSPDPQRTVSRLRELLDGG